MISFLWLPVKVMVVITGHVLRQVLSFTSKFQKTVREGALIRLDHFDVHLSPVGQRRPLLGHDYPTCESPAESHTSPRRIQSHFSCINHGVGRFSSYPPEEDVFSCPAVFSVRSGYQYFMTPQ